MNHRGKISLLPILLIVFFSISCSSTTQWPFTMATETPFLQQEGICENLECWDGIFPGLTTYNEAQILLEAKYGEYNIFMRNNRITWQPENVSNAYQNASLYTNNEEVVSIIEIGFSENQLTVLELLSQIGEPSYVYVFRAFSSDVYCAGSLILFPGNEIVAYLYPKGEFIGINPDQAIQGLTLLSPEQAENWDMTDTIRLEWQGYTDYCAIAFPETSGDAE